MGPSSHHWRLGSLHQSSGACLMPSVASPDCLEQLVMIPLVASLDIALGSFHGTHIKPTSFQVSDTILGAKLRLQHHFAKGVNISMKKGKRKADDTEAGAAAPEVARSMRSCFAFCMGCRLPHMIMKPFC